MVVMEGIFTDLTKNDEVLLRLDRAIERMRAQLPDATAGYALASLEKKRLLVESGHYVLKDVTEDCLRAVGAEIARWTRVWLVGDARRPRLPSVWLQGERK